MGTESAQLCQCTFCQGRGAMWTHPVLVIIPLMCLCFNSETTVKGHVSSFVIQVDQQSQLFQHFWGMIFRHASTEHLKMQDIKIKLLEQTEWIQA